MNKKCFLKILCYELRRTLLNRLFPGLLLVNGLYAWFLLSYDIVLGTAYTAPFSVWSYCTYLGKTLPVAAVTVLLLLSNYYSRKQKQIEELTAATPVSPFSQVLHSIPSVFDLFSAGYFSTFPLTLPVGADGEPAFTVSAAFTATRLSYLVLGIACICLTTVLSARKSRKA